MRVHQLDGRAIVGVPFGLGNAFEYLVSPLPVADIIILEKSATSSRVSFEGCVHRFEFGFIGQILLDINHVIFKV